MSKPQNKKVKINKPQIKGYVNQELKSKVQEYCKQMSISESDLISLAVNWFISKEVK